MGWIFFVGAHRGEVDLDFLTVGCSCALSRDFQLSIVFFYLLFFKG